MAASPRRLMLHRPSATLARIRGFKAMAEGKMLAPRSQSTRDKDCMRIMLGIAAFVATCVLVILVQAVSGNEGATFSEYMPSRFVAATPQ